MEETKTTVAKATTSKTDSKTVVQEFKKFNDLSMDEIKALPIVNCDLVKQLRNPKAKTNSNLAKDFIYFAYVHLIKGLVDVRITLSQAEFLHIKTSAKIMGDFNSMTIRVPVRFSKGKKKATEENYYLGEILDGHVVMKMDIVVDNGYYDESSNYNTNFDIVSSYYPIEFCPICGKKIEYVKSYDNSLKLV